MWNVERLSRKDGFKSMEFRIIEIIEIQQITMYHLKSFLNSGVQWWFIITTFELLLTNNMHTIL